ncbi:MAG TPA: prepilin-type N-terminal cleavage/methylation domain-containing protein [Verrucomicrobiota bacterium]|nr:prepilin-type N-terminal cleavage/methylation domain-containing protein [Verrucomicrobiota bacterium]
MKLFKRIKNSLSRLRGNRNSNIAGFTMIEIAIALAVIAIALVAIIGVLPSGFNIQRDNRIDSLIYNDARFFTEAIRTGAKGINGLEEYVDVLNGKPASGLTAREIIGVLSIPNQTNTAIVRSIAGTPAEMAPQTKDMAFKYQLSCTLTSFRYGNTYPSALETNLYELTLKFNYPVRGDNSVVIRSATERIFRTMIEGRLYTETNSNGDTLYFFER